MNPEQETSWDYLISQRHRNISKSHVMNEMETKQMSVKAYIILIKDKCNELVGSFFSSIHYKHFVRAWTDALTTDAKTFNGLFSGVRRVADGEAKKPDKVIREWCARTRYKWEDQPIVELCNQTLVALTEGGTEKEYRKWAGLLLKAAAAAGITTEADKQLTLDESNVNAYVEWDGEDLYVGDTVEVMNPAWYQNGQVLEQGHCKKIADGEE